MISVLNKKVFFGLVVFSILLSIVGVFLLVNALFFSDVSEFRSSESGLVPLADSRSGEEYSSFGVISLNIVSDDEFDDYIILENELED